MAFDTESIIRVASQLKEAQGRVAALEAQLKTLLAQSTQPRALNLKDWVMASASSHADLTLPERIITLLKNYPDTAFSFADVHKAVNGNESTLRATLARLIKEKRIASGGWGKYIAATIENPNTLLERIKAAKP